MRTSTENDSFFNVPLTKHHVSIGEQDLPFRYYEGTQFIAMYFADKNVVTQKLKGTGLEPVIIAGKAVAAIPIYEYIKSSANYYKEAAIAYLVNPIGKKPISSLLSLISPANNRIVGLYIEHLPVTTELANACGRELWGFPKFVTQIDSEIKGSNLKSAVYDPNGKDTIFTLKGKVGVGMPIPAMNLILYSNLNNDIYRTNINMRYGTTAAFPGSMRINIGESDHKMASDLRALNIDGKKPSMVLYADRFSSLLPMGVKQQIQ